MIRREIDLVNLQHRDDPCILAWPCHCGDSSILVLLALLIQHDPAYWFFRRLTGYSYNRAYFCDGREVVLSA